jgi:carboxypeptidase PM20D1
MGAIRTTVLLGAGALALLAGVVAIRTATFKPPGVAGLAAASLAPEAPIDASGAAQHLSQAVRFQTVSHQDAAQDDRSAWDAQRAWLVQTYPKLHAAATREIVGDGALIYTWKGSDPALDPIILMAHQDVVPVADETLSQWQAQPFSGEIKDGAVWGRGSIDDKGSLVALMEAAEALAAQGFKPRRTILIVSGNNEEVMRPVGGAKAIADTLKARGVKAMFALDEGMAVITDYPVVKAPVALIGVAEKGYATLRVTARGEGGHSSSPPRETAAVVLSRAVVRISDHPFPMRFSGPMADTLRGLGDRLPLTAKMAVANDWLFGPLLVSQIAATPAGASGLHTTIAPTMLEGSPKENVLPTKATARINYRIQPGDTADSVMRRARAAVGDLPVELAWEGTPMDPSPISSTRSDAYRAIAALAQAASGAPVAPTLVTAGTDSRWLAPVARDVYRFQPIRFALKDIEMVHGVNEHLRIEDLHAMAEFYARLMATTAG